jgi:pimeloyl-ACP methyl ester carboxylesterase
VLSYDKPGIGRSSGDWRQQTLRDRATEALAALDVLGQCEGIDPACVGLYGHSQGGWVAPLAAGMGESVAFVVVVSGPAVTPAEQGAYAVEQGMHADDWPDEQVAEAVAFVGELNEAARRGDAFSALLPRLAHLQTTAWYASFGKYFPMPEADSWAFSIRPDPATGLVFADYDPITALERVQCPLLAVFGERDWVVPVPKSVAVYEAALARAANHDATVRVFAGADHRLYVGDTFAQGFLDAVAAWILQRTRTA